LKLYIISFLTFPLVIDRQHRLAIVATAAIPDFFVATLAFVCDIAPIVQHCHLVVAAVVLVVAVVAEEVVVVVAADVVGVAEVAVVVVVGYQNLPPCQFPPPPPPFC